LEVGVCDGQQGQGDAQEEKAAMAGPVREVVGRALKALEERGP